MAGRKVQRGEGEAIQSLAGPTKELGVTFYVQRGDTEGLNRIYKCKIIPIILCRIVLYVGKSNSV